MTEPKKHQPSQALVPVKHLAGVKPKALEDLLDEPLINPDVRRSRFNARVTDIVPEGNGVRFSIALSREKVQQLLDDPEGHKAVQTKLANWILRYFPGEHISFQRLTSATFTVEGKSYHLPAYHVRMDGPEMLQKFNDLRSGATQLPDYRHLVEAMDGEEERQRYLMDRTADKPNHLPRHMLSVKFSIPRGTNDHLQDEFCAQYGKDVTFVASDSGPTELMVKVGATLKGETAQRFLHDYEQFKGR